MGDAATVIDWPGTDVPANMGDLLKGLPPGRYRLEVVPADDEDGPPPVVEPGDVLPPTIQNRVRAGMWSSAEGRGIPLAEVDARLRATIAAARAR
jgi:hypothetical protein